MMEKVIRYHCEHCNKDFRTPGRHHCKKDPALKNCYTCKHLTGWDDGETNEYGHRDPYPECEAGEETYLSEIQSGNYNMQCEQWEGRE